MKKNSALKNYRLPDKYGEWLGYRLLSHDRKKGSARLGLKLRDKHLSPAGRIHGGVISGFFDFACGAAVFSTMGPEDFCSTVELKVNYFSPLDSGDDLTCLSQVVFRGNRLCVVHAMLYRNPILKDRASLEGPRFAGGRKKPVAMATATFNIVSKRKIG